MSSEEMVEREGFEPPKPFQVRPLSSRIRSTGLCHLSVVTVILGNASYSAYLVSALLIEFTARLFIRLGGHAPPSVGKEALVQFMLVVTVFIGGWVCYQFLESPMIRWLQAEL